ncbi:MAG: hypothetical protein WDW36_009443 [Sanguina aurantia]
MNDCTFENCASLAGGGGALFITGLANFSILSCTFVNCSAWVAGGAVYATNCASATLNGNTFTGCAAGVLPDGVWPSFTPAITASTSDAITSQTGGGGLFASAVQTVLIQACTFQACSAVRGGGGGCHMRAATIVQFLTSSFTSCSAAYGGALAVISMHPAQGQNSNIFSTNFRDNVASDALPCPSRICNVYQSPSASGSGDGGAIYMEGFTVQVGYAGFGTSTSFLANQRLGPRRGDFRAAPLRHRQPHHPGDRRRRDQTQTGCFTASLDASSDFQGNSAVDGAGGAIFWSHPGNLHLSCNGSEYVPPRTSGAAEFPGVSADVQPCSSWGNNTVSSLGYGPVIASTPFYLQPGIQAAAVLQQQPAAAAECDDAAPLSLGKLATEAPPQLSLPVNRCSRCQTRQRLVARAQLGSGSSGEPLPAWPAQDYYGQLVTGTVLTSDPVYVRIESNNITGARLAEYDVTGGSAVFTEVALRGVAGEVYDVSFSGSTAYRELIPVSTSAVKVRPCQLNEYVDPGGRDLCVNCSAGTYNLVPTNTACVVCPPSATCSDACLGSAPCRDSTPDFAGFIVPTNGNWHSNMFSDQVLSCPNSASCTFPTRQSQLQRLQVAARATYQQLQRQRADDPPAPTSPSQPHHLRSLLAGHTQPSGTAAADPSLPHPASPDPAAGPLATLYAWVTRSPRTLLDSTGAPTAPAPPHADDSALQASFLAAINVTLGSYAAQQCSPGYTGLLCGSCSEGYGSQGIASCSRCPAAALNTLYYILATLVTIVTLGYTFYSSVANNKGAVGEEEEGKEQEPARGGTTSPGVGHQRDGQPPADPQSVGHTGHPVHNSMKGKAPQTLGGHLQKQQQQQQQLRSSSRQISHALGDELQQQQREQQQQQQQRSASLGPIQGREVSTCLSTLQLHAFQSERVAAPNGDGSPTRASGRRAERPAAAGLELAQAPSWPLARGATPPRRAYSTRSPVGHSQLGHAHPGGAAADARAHVSPGLGPTGPPGLNTASLGSPREGVCTARDAQPLRSPTFGSFSDPVQASVVGLEGRPAPGGAGRGGKGGEGGAKGQAGTAPPAQEEWKVSSRQASHLRRYFYDARDPFKEDSNQASAVILRIFLSYLQVLGLLQNVSQLYPNSLQTFLSGYYQVTSATAWVSLDCSLPAYRSVSNATITTLISALQPLYVAAACWVCWSASALYAYLRARNGGRVVQGIHADRPFFFAGVAAYLGHHITLTNVVVVFFFYPSAVQALLEVFDCDPVDAGAPSNSLMASAGMTYGQLWRQDYSQQCYAGQHRALAFAVGIPGLVLLAVGWPLFNGVWLHVNRAKVYTDLRFTGMYSFTFDGYQAKYAWWESVVTFRKLAIAALITFLHTISNEGLQLLTVSAVLGVSLGLQAACMPYEHGFMNWLEFLSLISSTLTIYFSLYFTYSVSPSALLVITILVTLINVLTIAVFVYALVRANWHILLESMGLSSKELSGMSYGDLRAHITTNRTTASLHPQVRGEDPRGPAGTD